MDKKSHPLMQVLASLTPLLIGLLLVFLLSFTDAKGAHVVLRIRLELIILGISILITTALFTSIMIRNRFKKQLGLQISQQKQDNYNEHQRFIRRLDHELKNPLTAIQLGLANLKTNMDGSDIKNSIANIDAQAARLNTLTTDLRKLAAFDHQEIMFESVNIADLLKETKEMCEEYGLGVDHNIQVILPAAPWPVPNVLGDSDLLQLALYNLIENAIKYSDSGDHVEIRASDNDSKVIIEIADTGVGIAESDLDHVWEELFRGNNTRDRSGSGIGLSLVKKIIERHHGDLTLASKENTGTRISISLPINR